MRTVVVEGVGAQRLRVLGAEAPIETLAMVQEHVVLAGNDMRVHAGAMQDALSRVELLILAQVADVPAMDQHGGTPVEGGDLPHGVLEGLLHIGIRRRVETDLAVADLREHEVRYRDVGSLRAADDA